MAFGNTTIVLKPVPALANPKTIVLAVPSTYNLARDEIINLAAPGRSSLQSDWAIQAQHRAYEGG